MDIMRKPWTVPANREVANKYFKVVRAQEEIHRLNVEVCRLNAWVHYEDQALTTAVDTAADPHLAAELHCHCAERGRVNNIHRARLSVIYRLEGYSCPGPYIPVPHGEDRHGELLDGVDSDEGLVDEDDGVQDEVLRLGDFLDSLTIN